MSKVHLIFATEFEASAFLPSLDLVDAGTSCPYYAGESFQLFISGVGLLKASGACSLYFTNQVKAGDRVINCGIAGAVNQDLSLHKVYEIGDLRLYDPRTFHSPEDPRFNFYKEECQEISVASEGLSLASSLYPIWLEEDRDLLANRRVDLVDMEAYAIAQVAQGFDCELSILKSVSDFTAKPSESSFMENAKLAIKALTEYLEA